MQDASDILRTYVLEHTVLPVIVDFDSLLLDAARSVHCDLRAPQSLHVFHLLEERLTELRATGLNIILVFNESLASMWEPDSAFAVVRALAPRHFARVRELTCYSVFDFTSPECRYVVDDSMPVALFFTDLCLTGVPKSLGGVVVPRPDLMQPFEQLFYLNKTYHIQIVLSRTVRCNKANRTVSGTSIKFRPDTHALQDPLDDITEASPLAAAEGKQDAAAERFAAAVLVPTVEAVTKSRSADWSKFGDAMKKAIAIADKAPLANRALPSRELPEGAQEFLAALFEALREAVAVFRGPIDMRTLDFFDGHLFAHVLCGGASAADEEKTAVGAASAGKHVPGVYQISMPHDFFAEIDKGLREQKLLLGPAANTSTDIFRERDYFERVNLSAIFWRLESVEEHNKKFLDKNYLRSLQKRARAKNEDIDKAIELLNQLIALFSFTKDGRLRTEAQALVEELKTTDRWKSPAKVNNFLMKWCSRAIMRAVSGSNKRKGEQYLIKFFEKYSQSLHPGKFSSLDVVLANPKAQKAKQLSKKEKIKLENTKIKLAEIKEEQTQNIERSRGNLRARRNVRQLLREFQDNIKTLMKKDLLKKNINHDVLAPMFVHRAVLQKALCVSMQQEEEDDDAKGKDGPVYIRELCTLLSYVSDVYRRFKAALTNEDFATLAECLEWEPRLKPIAEQYFRRRPVSRDTSIHLIFQLTHYGPYMPRELNTCFDGRVAQHGFWPDGWQRDLLDHVDARHSALVVAPTSSGKTFISYYVCEKVIEQNAAKGAQKGVVVIVSPTKALVNQMGAEIYHRYGDKFGIFTSNYQKDVRTCDVLVTVPDMLEIILTSSHPRTKQWVSRIEYVVLDEIHMMGHPSMGAPWQRIVTLLRCPFIALSATVHNPEALCEYFRFATDQEVALVTHDQRFSLLQVSAHEVNPDTQLPLENGIRPVDFTQLTGAVRPLHPIALLGKLMPTRADKLRLSSTDLSSKDSLTLYGAMAEAIGSEAVKSLSPQSFFAEELKGEDRALCTITQTKARAYAIALKDEYWRWIQDDDRRSVAADVRRILTSRETDDQFVEGDGGMLGEDENLNRPQQNQQGGDGDGDGDGNGDGDEEKKKKTNEKQPFFPAFLLHHFSEEACTKAEKVFRTLLDLRRAHMLPVIVFNFSRSWCVDLAKYMNLRLEALQLAYERSREGKRQEHIRGELDKSRREFNLLAARVRTEGAKCPPSVLEDQKRVKARIDELSRQITAEPVHRFSFANEAERMDAEDRKYWVSRLLEHDRHHMEEIERGVGIHHEGMSVRYRNMVEVMFRGRHLPIVFSTTTLAFGVNMPCRTVLLAQNHAQDLTPMMYRQMSGRAGRRGFDKVGNVVFLGSEFDRRTISYLATHPLGDIVVPRPASTSTFLRLLMHQNVCDKREDGALERNLKRGLAVYRERSLEQTVLIQHRIMADFCASRSLINADAKLLAETGLLTHLHGIEPLNFVLQDLVRCRSIARMCHNFEKLSTPEQEEVSRKLLEVISHFIGIGEGHVFLGASAAAGGDDQAPMKPYLEPLAKSFPQVAKELAERQTELVPQYVAYSRALRKLHAAKASSTAGARLPLSGLVEDEASKDADVMRGEGLPYDIVNPFVALSGAVESRIKTTADLYYATREEFRLDLPLFETVDVLGHPAQLSSYALDFYKVGVLMNPAHYLYDSPSALWEALNEFSTVLNKLVFVLTEQATEEANRRDERIAEEAKKRANARARREDMEETAGIAPQVDEEAPEAGEQDDSDVESDWDASSSGDDDQDGGGGGGAEEKKEEEDDEALHVQEELDEVASESVTTLLDDVLPALSHLSDEFDDRLHKAGWD